MKHLYNSKIDFQESTKTRDDYGSWVITWADVSGLISIPCRINWLSGFSRGERYIDNKVFWVRDAKVYLAYYSTITTAMRAVYNSVNYDIIDLGNVDELGKYMTLDIKRSEI